MEVISVVDHVHELFLHSKLVPRKVTQTHGHTKTPNPQAIRIQSLLSMTLMGCLTLPCRHVHEQQDTSCLTAWFLSLSSSGFIGVKQTSLAAWFFNDGILCFMVFWNHPQHNWVVFASPTKIPLHNQTTGAQKFQLHQGRKVTKINQQPFLLRSSTVPVEKSTWHCRDESHWRLSPPFLPAWMDKSFRFMSVGKAASPLKKTKTLKRVKVFEWQT